MTPIEPNVPQSAAIGCPHFADNSLGLPVALATGSQKEQLQAKQDAGQQLTPVENGVLARLNDQTLLASSARSDGTPVGSTTAAQADGSFIGTNAQGKPTVFPATGFIENIAPIRPQFKSNSLPGDVIFVNGIDTSPSTAVAQAQQIATRTNNDVRIIFAKTDAGKTAGQAFDPSSTMPAINTLSDQIVRAAKSGTPIHLYGHSAGGVIIRNALVSAQDKLRNDLGYVKIQGNGGRGALTSAQRDQISRNAEIDKKVEKMLGNVEVETSGSAAGSWHVDGPKYLHWVNDSDPVIATSGLTAGLGNSGGKDSVTVHFSKGSWADPLDAHDLGGYLNVRASQGGFNQAYYNNYAHQGSTDHSPTRINVEYPK